VIAKRNPGDIAACSLSRSIRPRLVCPVEGFNRR